MNLEDRWEKLVMTIAIEAGDQSMIFGLPNIVIQQAAYNVLSGHSLPTRYVPPLPPQFEQTLERIDVKL